MKGIINILTICGSLADPTSFISLVNFLIPGTGTLSSSSSPLIYFRCSLLFFVGLLSRCFECFFPPLDPCLFNFKSSFPFSLGLTSFGEDEEFGSLLLLDVCLPLELVSHYNLPGFLFM